MSQEPPPPPQQTDRAVVPSIGATTPFGVAMIKMGSCTPGEGGMGEHIHAPHICAWGGCGYGLLAAPP